MSFEFLVLSFKEGVQASFDASVWSTQWAKEARHCGFTSWRCWLTMWLYKRANLSAYGGKAGKSLILRQLGEKSPEGEKKAKKRFHHEEKDRKYRKNKRQFEENFDIIAKLKRLAA